MDDKRATFIKLLCFRIFKKNIFRLKREIKNKYLKRPNRKFKKQIISLEKLTKKLTVKLSC